MTYRKDSDKPHRQIANNMGISHDTYARCKYIDKHGSEKDKEDLSAGTSGLSVNLIYNKIKNEKIKKDFSFPDGKFSVVFATPFIDEIDFRNLNKLPVKQSLDKNAVIYLETPERFLKQAFSLLNAWGFRYERISKLFVDDFDESYNLILGGYKNFGEPKTFNEISDLNECYPNERKLSLFHDFQNEGWEFFDNWNRKNVYKKYLEEFGQNSDL